MSAAERHRDLVTGNREMDEEHALQLRLLRELVDNLESGDAPAALEVFDRLEAFTSAHFLAEELLMRLHAYPALEAHVADHAGFLGELKGVRARLAEGLDEEAREDADAFARRLLAHIASADHAFADFQRAGGASAA